MKSGIVLCVLLAGCASSRSGIVQDGTDTYTVIVTGKTGFVSSGDLKLSAYQQASRHCQSRSRILEVITENEQRGGVLGKFPGAQLKFRCIPPK